MKLLILNGPNINMLGIREVNVYGSTTYADLQNEIKKWAIKENIEIKEFQSNHEGALIDEIQNAYFSHYDGIIFNPGGYTHTSIALLDALKAVNIDCIEVHISSVSKREEFRQKSFIRQYCFKTIEGKGILGYYEAIIAFKQRLGG